MKMMITSMSTQILSNTIFWKSAYIGNIKRAKKFIWNVIFQTMNVILIKNSPQVWQDSQLESH